MVVYPWEISILDGVHNAVLNAALKVIGDTSITGDLAVSGDISATNIVPKFGEMYIYNNSTATQVTTAGTVRRPLPGRAQEYRHAGGSSMRETRRALLESGISIGSVL